MIKSQVTVRLALIHFTIGNRLIPGNRNLTTRCTRWLPRSAHDSRLTWRSKLNRDNLSYQKGNIEDQQDWLQCTALHYTFDYVPLHLCYCTMYDVWCLMNDVVVSVINVPPNWLCWILNTNTNNQSNLLQQEKMNIDFQFVKEYNNTIWFGNFWLDYFIESKYKWFIRKQSVFCGLVNGLRATLICYTLSHHTPIFKFQYFSYNQLENKTINLFVSDWEFFVKI